MQKKAFVDFFKFHSGTHEFSDELHRNIIRDELQQYPSIVGLYGVCKAQSFLCIYHVDHRDIFHNTCSRLFSKTS